MVLGHFGVAFGAKKFAPKISLGTLFIAVQWADLLWPVLLLLDIEKVKVQPGNPHFPLGFVSYPVTHSLLMGLVWGAIFGVIYYFAKKDKAQAVTQNKASAVVQDKAAAVTRESAANQASAARDKTAAFILGLCVLSHWLLDLVVHAPDLPLFPGDSPKLGLGLWDHPLATALVESAIFLVGLTLYLKNTRAKNTTGKWSLWLLVALLVINQFAGQLSPLPSSAHAIGWAGQYQWIFVLLGYWVDRNRTATIS